MIREKILPINHHKKGYSDERKAGMFEITLSAAILLIAGIWFSSALARELKTGKRPHKKKNKDESPGEDAIQRLEDSFLQRKDAFLQGR